MEGYPVILFFWNSRPWDISHLVGLEFRFNLPRGMAQMVEYAAGNDPPPPAVPSIVPPGGAIYCPPPPAVPSIVPRPPALPSIGMDRVSLRPQPIQPFPGSS